MDRCKDNAHLDKIKQILEKQPEVGPKPINIEKYTKQRSKFETYRVNEKPDYFEKTKRGGQKIRLANEIKNLKNELLPTIEKHNLDKLLATLREKQQILNKLRHKNRDKKRMEQHQRKKISKNTNQTTNTSSFNTDTNKNK